MTVCQLINNHLRSNHQWAQIICSVSHYEKKDNFRKMKVVLNYEHEEETVSLYMEDVTDLMIKYHKVVAKEFESTHEANYAHEQLTPLNCIITNS